MGKDEREEEAPKEAKHLSHHHGFDCRRRFPAHFARFKHERRWTREGTQTRICFYRSRRVCLRARKRMRLKFSSPALHFLALVSSLVRDPKRAFVFEWTTLGETNSRVKSFAPCSESISARECVLFERVVRSRGVLRRRDGNEISSTFREDHQTRRAKKGPERPIFLSVSPRGFRSSSLFLSLFSLSFTSFMPFIIISTHAFAFLYLSYSSHVFR